MMTIVADTGEQTPDWTADLLDQASRAHQYRMLQTTSRGSFELGYGGSEWRRLGGGVGSGLDVDGLGDSVFDRTGRGLLRLVTVMLVSERREVPGQEIVGLDPASITVRIVPIRPTLSGRTERSGGRSASSEISPIAHGGPMAIPGIEGS